MMMKIASLFALGLLTSMVHDPIPDLSIGASLPKGDHAMKDVSGKEIALKDVVGQKGLLVVFSCNTCPFVVGSDGSDGWEGRYPELVAYSQRMGVNVAFLNSNEAKRDKGDGYADMQERYEAKGLAGYYLYDEKHVVADAFGARTTPHVFLFNKDLKLVYKGAIDDNVANASEVKEHWAKNAVSALASGSTIDPSTTRNIGCSIKRVHDH